MLGLRRLSGFSLAQFKQQFGADLESKYRPELEQLREEGLLEISADIVKLSEKGLVLADKVFERLVYE